MAFPCRNVDIGASATVLQARSNKPQALARPHLEHAAGNLCVSKDVLSLSRGLPSKSVDCIHHTASCMLNQSCLPALINVMPHPPSRGIDRA